MVLGEMAFYGMSFCMVTTVDKICSLCEASQYPSVSPLSGESLEQRKCDTRVYGGVFPNKDPGA